MWKAGAKQIPKLIVSRVLLCSLEASVTITSLSLNVSVLSYPYASVALVGSRGRWHEVHRTYSARGSWPRAEAPRVALALSSTPTFSVHTATVKASRDVLAFQNGNATDTFANDPASVQALNDAEDTR